MRQADLGSPHDQFLLCLVGCSFTARKSEMERNTRCCFCCPKETVRCIGSGSFFSIDCFENFSGLCVKDFTDIKFELAYEDETVQITYARSSLDGPCLVAFTGAGMHFASKVVQREEFLLQDNFGLVIWIIDKTVSWGLALDFDLISQEVEALKGARKVYSIGASMGAYNAILFSSRLQAERVIAFNPQFSVNVNYIGPDGLSERSRSLLTKWSDQVPENILGFFSPRTKYAIVMGSAERDSLHHKYFHRLARNSCVEVYKIDVDDHNVAKYLKRRSLLKRCIFTFFKTGTLQNFFSQNLDLPENRPLKLVILQMISYVRRLF